MSVINPVNSQLQTLRALPELSMSGQSFTVNSRAEAEEHWGCELERVERRVSKIKEDKQLYKLGVRLGDKLLKINDAEVTNPLTPDHEHILIHGHACTMEFLSGGPKRKRDEPEQQIMPPTKRKRVDLSLPNRLVLTPNQDRQLVHAIKHFIKHTWGYKKIDEVGRQHLTQLAQACGATFDMAYCVYRSVGSFNGIRNENFLRQTISRLPVSGLRLASVKVDVPPLNIVRRFLAMKLKWQKGKVKSLIKKLTNGEATPEQPPAGISAELFAEIVKLAENDSFTGKSEMDRQVVESEKFEQDVQNWCTAQGITFKTEQDIRSESVKAPTPDILFDYPVTLNGHTNIRWLELKDYYGSLCANKKTCQGWKKQLNRYRNHYGEGALVFHYGFCTAVSSEINFLCADASQVFLPGKYYLGDLTQS